MSNPHVPIIQGLIMPPSILTKSDKRDFRQILIILEDEPYYYSVRIGYPMLLLHNHLRCMVSARTYWNLEGAKNRLSVRKSARNKRAELKYLKSFAACRVIIPKTSRTALLIANYYLTSQYRPDDRIRNLWARI